MNKPTYEELEKRVKEFERSEAEHRKTEETLREHEENLSEILYSIPVGIIMEDEETGKISSANMVLLAMIGELEEGLIGKNFSEIVTKDKEETFIKNALEENDIPVLITDTNLKINNKGFLLHSIIDISERKRVEEERIKNEKLEGVLEMAEAASHELNQPLQTVLGYSNMISSSLEEDSPLKSKVEKIYQAASAMGEITLKIQNISKYETIDYLDRKIINLKKAADE